MKFSVLLPTRNRIELLKYAVETVRRQDYADWEIILSDNCSDQDVAGYVRSLADPRIRYFRTNEFVSVTENWNRALEKAAGDYIIMLGDDDGLMPGYFSFLESEIRRFHFPDFVYTAAYIYAYPGVIPEHPRGYLKLFQHARFLSGRKDPYILEPKEAREYARDSMSLKMSFAFNMQYSLIKGDMVRTASRKGDFFQSPYPDFYATNVLFLLAERILIVPRPMVIIGITSESYGFYFFNNKEEEGIRDLLKNAPRERDIERLRGTILPGSIYTTYWMLAMESIRLNYGDKFKLRVDYKRYRRSQIRHLCHAYFRNKTVCKDRIIAFRKMLGFREMLFFHALWISYSMAPLFPESFRKLLNEAYRFLVSKDIPVDSGFVQDRSGNLMEVFERFSS